MRGSTATIHVHNYTEHKSVFYITKQVIQKEQQNSLNKVHWLTTNSRTLHKQ